MDNNEMDEIFSEESTIRTSTGKTEVMFYGIHESPKLNSSLIL